jgi:hypothetical protein
MRKLIYGLIVIMVLMFSGISFAGTPKFKLHIIKLDSCKGVNYSINYPVVIDYDNDGDMDIILMSKEGELYVYENLTIGG